jgi:hypothetical protein
MVEVEVLSFDAKSRRRRTRTAPGCRSRASAKRTGRQALRLTGPRAVADQGQLRPVVCGLADVAHVGAPSEGVAPSRAGTAHRTVCFISILSLRRTPCERLSPVCAPRQAAHCAKNGNGCSLKREVAACATDNERRPCRGGISSSPWRKSAGNGRLNT